MSKAYLIIFCIFLALPVLAAAITVTYICFKMSVLAGVAAVAICGLAISSAMLIVIFKIISHSKRD